MNNNTILLRAFMDSREDFEKYGPYVLALKNMDRIPRQTLTHIQGFYVKYPKVDTIPESEFRLYLDASVISNFAKNNDEYIKSIYEVSTTNTDLKMDVIEATCERHFMSEVVDKAAQCLDNNQAGVLSSVQDIVDEYHGIIRRPPIELVEYKLDLTKLINDEILTNGAPFCNQTPNDIIRGMRTGQLGLIYAYVDTGKTSYGVSNMCSVAKYLKDNNIARPVIYAANEEDISRVSLRTIQCLCNWNSDEIAANAKTVTSVIQQRGYGHMLFFDQVVSMPLVEKLLIKYNPRVMFIDQGTKVNIPRSKHDGVNRLEEVFNTYRSLAKQHDCTIVCLAQGGDTCDGKKYPELRDIYGSHVAIQGELDWAISLGVDGSDSKYKDWRFCNITKNKGDRGSYSTRFDTKRCQFREVS